MASSDGTVDLVSLQNASRVLQDTFNSDGQIIPDLGETLTAQGGASSSYSIFPDDIRVPFQKRKLVGIPEGLFQYYSSASVNSHMGLLPEIERVWISIDHKLFLWDYMEGQEISSFTDQPAVITHVALVQPKKTLFIEEISHLLVICTPISVLLIAVSSSPLAGASRPRKDIKLFATDLTVVTEVEMTSVIGTQDGRIFMCGSQDGNLYELHYQETESWFGKRVQLVNHSIGSVQSLLPRFAMSSSEDRIISMVSDRARNCFYTLTDKNTISVYQPTTDKNVHHVQLLNNLYKAAQDKVPGTQISAPQTFQIISLHVIDPAESRSGFQLLALTTNGVRLYFASPAYGSYGSTSSARSLQLQHVRLPPSNLLHPDEQQNPHRAPVAAFGAQSQPPQQSRPYLLSCLDSACYIEGLTVAAQQGDADGTDFLLCMSPDLTRIGTLEQVHQQAPVIQPQQPWSHSLTTSAPSIRPPLTEYATLLSIPGRTWAMAPFPRNSPAIPSGAPTPVVTNELALQFGEPPRQFMILTNVGLTFLVKRRAMDYLKAVIEELQSEGNVQPIIEFRDSFGRNQTCAMLLGLACGNTFLSTTDDSDIPNVAVVSPDVAAVAKQAFYDFGERPIWNERPSYGTAENLGSALYSGRRHGLAQYFARLVRPVWKTKLTGPGAGGLQQPLVPDSLLVIIQKNLYALKDFLDKNPHLFHSSTSDSAARAPAWDQEAWKAEQSSVSELLSLLARTIEALSFVLLLNDYRLPELITQCDPQVQNLITSLTYEDLITSQTGMSVSRALVNVIIDQQIGQQISVDTISEVLQHRCGAFCSTDDVMLYKAKENIKKAIETRNLKERQNWLAESLRLYLKGARILSVEKLREICGDFQHLNYSRGALELPLTCADVFDTGNMGMEYWLAGMPHNDGRKDCYDRRLQCYELVLDSLSVFEGKCNTAGASPEVIAEAEAVRSHAYDLAFASADQMFHSTMYDWLIERDLADDLLEIRPPFLESHLKREPVTVSKYQLLWQFYVKDGQPLRAAEILGDLAGSTEFDLNLETRLEYLTLAVGNAKSHPISIGGRHETAIAFLTELEEKLEVAQVQLEIYNTLSPHMNDAPEVGARIKLLSTNLLSMSELFQDYAVAFDLPAIKLLCLHVSEHTDTALAMPIWNQIFDQILEEEEDPLVQADQVIAKVVPLGQRFYPSESAFPLRPMSDLLVRFALERRDVLPHGWAPRILVQCGVPFVEIWDVLGEMYESHVPPFNAQANVQALSSDIAVLLSDWLEEAKRPNSSVGRGEFPVGRIDLAIDKYVPELNADRTDTKAIYENIKRQLRRNW
ncbi:nucleoporin [Mycena floridula]|nr:nucleoporin [Mycena floridula]